MWMKEQSNEMLPLLDLTNPGLIIERKNYKEIEMDGRIAYECDIRHITVEDYYHEKQDVTEIKVATLEQAVEASLGVHNVTEEKLEKIKAIKANGKIAKTRKKLSQVDKDNLLFTMAELMGLIPPEEAPKKEK